MHRQSLTSAACSPRALLCAALFVMLASCTRETGPTVPSMDALKGRYDLLRVNGQPFPATGLAAVAEDGPVTLRSADLATDGQEWILTLGVRNAKGVNEVRKYLGPIAFRGGDSLSFVDYHGIVVFRGHFRRPVIEINPMYGLAVEFTWADYYKYD